MAKGKVVGAFPLPRTNADREKAAPTWSSLDGRRMRTAARAFAAELYSALFPAAWMRRWLEDARGNEVEMDHLRVMVDPLRAAVDVGANVGKYSFRLSGLSPEVYSFEPHPSLARKLRHALPKNVVVQAVAVSDAPGVAQLKFPIINGERSLALASIENGSFSNSVMRVETVVVPTARLDDLVAKPVGFIKIDVEGHELAVLRGAIGILNKWRPTVLVEAEERHRAGAVSRFVNSSRR